MIYLDNAATSFPKPEPVYQALDRFARTSLANPGRAGHRMAMAAERTLDEAPAGQIIGSLIGLIAALLISTMVAVLLNPLPFGLGVLLSLSLAAALIYVGVRTAFARGKPAAAVPETVLPEKDAQ